MARCFEVSEADAFHCPTPIETEATSTDLARAAGALGLTISDTVTSLDTER